MEKLLQHYQALTDRERLLVLISGIVMCIALFYFAIWSPLNHSLAKHQVAIQNQNELLNWVEKNTIRAMQLRNSQGKPTVFNGSLLQVVNQTAERLKINITRMQPQDDEIQVWVDQVAFNDALDWLQSLEKMGINIIEADLAEADGPGLVKVRRLKLSKT